MASSRFPWWKHEDDGSINTVVTEEQTVVDKDAAKHHTHTQVYICLWAHMCTDSGDEGQGQAAASPEISEPASALVLLTRGQCGTVLL